MMVQPGPPRSGKSIFSTMTELAIKFDAINLAQGFPSFDGPDLIKEAAIRAIWEGKNQYAPAAGILPLREKISERITATKGLNYDPVTEVTVFSGATEAIFCAIGSLFQKGDEFIGLDPFYESYRDSAQIFGLTYRGVALQPPTWHLDLARLKAAIGPRTKGLIINTPHNPTGRVLTRQELQTISELACQHDLVVIADEVYEEIIFDGRKHLSIATLPGMRDRTVLISSTSKTFSFTGWKVGFATAPAALTDRLRFFHQSAVFCSATPLQWGMVDAFSVPSSYYAQLKDEYDARRNKIISALTDIGFRCHKPEGAYFVLADYSGLSDKLDYAFAEMLVSQAKVATIPISGFFDKAHDQSSEAWRFVRFGFCKDLSTLDAAYDRLKQFFG